MTVSQVLHNIGKIVADNSPIILTSVGVAGSLTTAILTGKACWQASRILLGGEDSDPWELENQTFFEKTKIVWPLFIPPLASAAVTVTSIVLANRIGTRRAAALAAAYSISEKAFEEYKEKVTEKLGKTKEREVRDEIAQNRVDKNPVNNSEIIITGNGDSLFLDLHSNRYFKSTMEDVKKAVNDTNYQIIHHDYASLNDFYDRLGIDHTRYGEELGWTSMEKLEVSFSTTLSKDQRPCITIDFTTEPMRDYFRVH